VVTKLPLVLVEDSQPHEAALNMALDEALLQLVSLPLLRCYTWARPAVSFGYFGRFRQVVQDWPGRVPVRRWTGGGTVAHGDDFTYSLILPCGHPWTTLGVKASYRAIHEAVACAMEHSCGFQPRLAIRTAEAISDACFENPAESDVLIGERKIAGAAQRRTRSGMLHQGSVRLPLGAQNFAHALAAALSVQIRRPLAPHELGLAEKILASRYGTREWLERH
jgi:lipoate-protein ligase A